MTTGQPVGRPKNYTKNCLMIDVQMLHKPDARSKQRQGHHRHRQKMQLLIIPQQAFG